MFKIFSNKKVLAIVYVLLIVLAAFLAKSIFEKRELLKKGTKIEVTVLKLPNCDYVRKNDYKFLKFSFENKTFSKRIKTKYCKKLRENGLYEGSKLMLITNKEKDIFLFSFENFKINIISFFLVELVFVYCLFRLFFNKRKED
ncbi:hypothetical protein [Pontimicrobium sp. IMCC45349]|uniref:hypothetical protein n=1 Tax=Pontimicrobium sp. IMCC45349 TaxID=3391574 RepID=UPI0039A006E6